MRGDARLDVARPSRVERTVRAFHDIDVSAGSRIIFQIGSYRTLTRPVTRQRGETSVARFFGLRAEKTAGKFPRAPVIRHTLATLPVFGTRKCAIARYRNIIPANHL